MMNEKEAYLTWPVKWKMLKTGYSLETEQVLNWKPREFVCMEIGLKMKKGNLGVSTN